VREKSSNSAMNPTIWEKYQQRDKTGDDLNVSPHRRCCNRKSGLSQRNVESVSPSVLKRCFKVFISMNDVPRWSNFRKATRGRARS
jgi:hypothetical protein